MIIMMTHNIFGFNDVKAIRESVDFAVWEQTSLINGDFISLENKEEVLKFSESLLNSKLMKLSRFCGDLDKERKTYPITLFEEVASNMLKDFKENKYIYWYLLHEEDVTRNHPNLSFLGSPNERIIKLKDRYKELWGKPYDK